MNNINRFIFFVLGFVFSSCNDDNGSFKCKELIFKSGRLYILTTNWGITGDRQMTIISTKKNDKIISYNDSATSYFFEGLEPFVYEVRDDSLTIFTRHKATEPLTFSTKITVVQKLVDNSTFTKMIKSINHGNARYSIP
ncbi:hypothetical protein GCM10023092_06300 [Rurimicrobium arvi]|uniref:DUF4369 domain-containing protein n=1 Tax=Rurimicrobium arvi TaxID=2049916 RepID=A0ABP8MGT7_9BACT